MEKFKGKHIYGILAGCMQTGASEKRKDVDNEMYHRGFEKRFIGLNYRPKQPSPNQTSETRLPREAPDGPDASPGNGDATTTTTTPAAMPRRVRQVPVPMRRAQVQVRPRLVFKSAGFKLSSLI